MLHFLRETFLLMIYPLCIWLTLVINPITILLSHVYVVLSTDNTIFYHFCLTKKFHDDFTGVFILRKDRTTTFEDHIRLKATHHFPTNAHFL